MPVRVKCPGCEVTLALKADPEGKRIRCPKCGQAFRIRTQEPPRSAEAPFATAGPPEPSTSPNSHPVSEFDGNLFYKIHYAFGTWKEFFWSTRNPLLWPFLLIVAIVIKVFRVSPAGSTDDPPVHSLEPFRTKSESLSNEVRTIADQLQDLRFIEPVAHHVNDTYHGTEIETLTFRHPDGNAVAKAYRRVWNKVRPAKTYLSCSIITQFSDGTFLVTTSAQPDMIWPKDRIDLRRNTNASPDELWEAHQAVLRDEHHSKSVNPARSQAATTEIVESHHDALREFHVGRGIFKEMTSAEDQRARSGYFVAPTSDVASDASAEPSTAAGLARHGDVLEEIERQRTKKPSWVSAIVILVISIALFMGIGSVTWSWDFVMMLIPVLFVHELGHYVAMKLFGYQNVKMFFIPLFGAAVSGRHYNVTAWKKVLVSLAGPVPSIVLAIALGSAGLFMEDGNRLIDIAFFTILLNGLNLLPLLPFDGGWVVHSLVFSRHHLLDGIFRAATAVLLITISALSGDMLLVGLGVFMLLGVKAALRSGRIVKELRSENLPLPSDDSPEIPVESATKILDRVEEHFPPHTLNTKTRAGLVQSIFESINSPPPGIAATLLLGGLYCVSLIATVAFAFVLVLGKSTTFDDLLDISAAAPETPYACESSQLWEGANVAEALATDEVTLFAEFDNEQSAQDTFEKIRKQLPATAAIRLFGRAVLVAVPTADDLTRKQTLALLESKTDNVQVQSEEFSVPFSLICIAPSNESAEQITSDLDQYLTATYTATNLIPPWSPTQTLTDDQRLARRTLDGVQLFEDDMSEGQDQELEQLYARQQRLMSDIREMIRRGDSKDLEKARKEINTLGKQIQQRQFDVLKNSGEFDNELIDLYATQPSYPDGDVADGEKIDAYRAEMQTWRQEMAQRLGALPVTTEVTRSPLLRYAAHGGGASRAGLLLRLDYVRFHRPIDGVTALTDWLCSQNCIDLKYRFGSPEFPDFPER